jgi:hypothetical protein
MSDASFLAATRDSYDAVAVEYAEEIAPRLDGKPFDLALLRAFAELVLAVGTAWSRMSGVDPGEPRTCCGAWGWTRSASICRPG